jgi:ABC-type uncharacterized transport system auxiliary subunit
MMRIAGHGLLPAASVALALLLGACSGLHSSRAVPQVYALRYASLVAAGARADLPASTAGGEGAPLPTLQVLRPLAAPGLDDDHVTLLRDGQKLDYYAGARWAGPLPEVLQQLAIEALRARGSYRAVQGDAAPFVSEQVLQLEILSCTAVYGDGGAPAVQVRLVASFGRRGDRSLLATQLLEAQVPASDNHLGAVAAAYERALNQALAQLAPP